MQHLFPAVDAVGFSTRVMNVMASLRIDDLKQLAQYTEQDLFRLPNLGRKSVEEIRAALADHGLALGMVFAADEALRKSEPVWRTKSVDEWIRELATGRIPFLQSASLAGCAAADNHLGRLYLEGIGTGRDYRKARVLFIRAARRGCRLGYANLALIYRIGYGVRRSAAKAERLMRRFEKAGKAA